MVNILYDDCPSYTIIKNWVVTFKRGKYSIQDDETEGPLQCQP